jgi:hypothetical protein
MAFEIDLDTLAELENAIEFEFEGKQILFAQKVRMTIRKIFLQIFYVMHECI